MSWRERLSSIQPPSAAAEATRSVSRIYLEETGRRVWQDPRRMIRSSRRRIARFRPEVIAEFPAYAGPAAAALS
jgi:hypothetical protein